MSETNDVRMNKGNIIIGIGLLLMMIAISVLSAWGAFFPASGLPWEVRVLVAPIPIITIGFTIKVLE